MPGGSARGGAGRAFRVFRVMRSRERSERQAEPELFPKPLCRKEASDPTERSEGGGASDFGITRYYTN